MPEKGHLMAETDPTSARAQTFWSGEAIRWVIVTLLIPFAGFVWNRVEKGSAERRHALEEQRDSARSEAQRRLESARSESEIVIRLLPSLTSADEAARGIALAVLVNLASREALSSQLIGAVQVAISLTEKRVTEGKATPAEQVALSNLAETSDVPTSDSGKATPASSAPRPAPVYKVQVPRVYIHIFDEADRPAARQLESWIKTDRRWLAPGIENVLATAARGSARAPTGSSSVEVRYFNEEDRDRAEQIVRYTISAGRRAVVKRVGNMRVPVGQIEVWFPQQSPSSPGHG